MSAAPPAAGMPNQKAPPTTLLLQGIAPHLFQTRTKTASPLRRRTVMTGSMLKKQMHADDNQDAEAEDTPKSSQSSVVTRTQEEAQAEIRRLESEVQSRDKHIAALRTTLSIAQALMGTFMATFQQHTVWLASQAK
ncbi:hypothetical protein C8R45DRAFT_942049 [Mycena sanguinolenta]|nr:hypothetical protein C8R45DRAFT_942049 [Mycena sanguinolenta]